MGSVQEIGVVFVNMHHLHFGNSVNWSLRLAPLQLFSEKILQPEVQSLCHSRVQHIDEIRVYRNSDPTELGDAVGASVSFCDFLIGVKLACSLLDGANRLV